MTTAFHFRDRYERRDGEWFFEHRGGMPMWSYSQHEDPLDGFVELPGGMPIRLRRSIRLSWSSGGTSAMTRWPR